MKLTRTTRDRPDFPDNEVRQPTCYDPRDPLRPWLAIEAPQFDEDVAQVMRQIAETGCIAPRSVDEPCIERDPPTKPGRRKKVAPTP